MIDKKINILLTNDDGYQAKGITTLVKLLKPYGNITVVAPKYAQSGMSLAVPLGYRPIAIKHLGVEDGVDWYYVDNTTSSCVKYGIDNVLTQSKPDIVVSGINHGANYATAALYSATLGGAMEAAINKIPGIGVSIDDFGMDPDFSAIEALFPELFEKLYSNLSGEFGIYYNINFPDLKKDQIKGIRAARMGKIHWIDEYQKYDSEEIEAKGIVHSQGDKWKLEHAEDGEEFYVMKGKIEDFGGNGPDSDHYLIKEGYVTVTAHNIMNSVPEEMERIKKIIE